MNIFISGGCKNGKSYHAQELARDMAVQGGLPLYYLATMIPHDDEDRARICRHLSERDGWGFETVEQGTNICAALDSRTVSGQPVERGGVFLLDSVTALLSNEMFRADGSVDFDAGSRIAEDLTRFAAQTGNTVFIRTRLPLTILPTTTARRSRCATVRLPNAAIRSSKSATDFITTGKDSNL